MILLADTPVTTSLDYTAVVSTLDGVTTALVAFILVGLIYPHIVKNRSRFYMVLWAAMLIILVHTLTLMVRSTGFTVFTGVITGLLQVAGLGMAVMSTGGLGPKELAGELSRSYEVMRRGEETKEVIIPLNMPKKQNEDEAGRVVYTIDTPPGPAKPPASPSDHPIPLE